MITGTSAQSPRLEKINENLREDGVTLNGEDFEAAKAKNVQRSEEYWAGALPAAVGATDLLAPWDIVANLPSP